MTRTHISFKSLRLELADGTVIDVDPGKIVDVDVSFTHIYDYDADDRDKTPLYTKEVDVVIHFKAPHVHFAYDDGMGMEMGYFNGVNILSSPPPELPDGL